ncbi:hypothetical protein R1sor_006035 [Riccia sorocarpa]|uniref:Uncharacterized protein n=1 Tax=Riccia sorocarpa TaxID=122646 RepID=A0ABD3HPY0_9MARC
MLAGWKLGRASLRVNLEGVHLASDLKMEVIHQLGVTLHGPKDKSWQAVMRRVRTMRIRDLQELKGVPMMRLITADYTGALPDVGSGGTPLLVTHESGMKGNDKTRIQRTSKVQRKLGLQLGRRATGEEEVRDTSLITTVEKLLKPAYSALLIVFISFSRVSWQDRCREVFEKERSVTPIHVILQEADRNVASIKRKVKAKEATAKLDTAAK